jgi:hypothetical protein
MRALVPLLLILVSGCHFTAGREVLGVRVDRDEGEVRWGQAADEIAACATKLDDPRVLNGIRVKSSMSEADLWRDCAASDAGACYIATKGLAVVGPPARGVELPGFCHEVGHHILYERSAGPLEGIGIGVGDADPCHCVGVLWAVIDGTKPVPSCPCGD